MIDKNREEVNRLFGKGRTLYKEGRWPDAYQIFEKGFLLGEKDGPCRTYMERCLRFDKDPPKSPWEGVFEFAVN